MIELNKTYQDKSGNSVRIICVDRPDVTFSVIGLVGSSVFVYDKNGRFGITTSANDLILHEDYSTYKIDEPVMVRDTNEGRWVKRHFSHATDGLIYTWADGGTSWSNYPNDIKQWNQCRRPTAEELGEK